MRPVMILTVALFAGCGDTGPSPAPLNSRVGQNCAVHYRRDALGMAADLPTSVETGEINGATVTQLGQLMEVAAEWIVINFHGQEFHIPQAAILYIECGNNITQKPGLLEPLMIKTDPGGHAEH